MRAKDIVLGLLMQGPKSGYDIKQEYEIVIRMNKEIKSLRMSGSKHSGHAIFVLAFSFIYVKVNDCARHYPICR